MTNTRRAQGLGANDLTREIGQARWQKDRVWLAKRDQWRREWFTRPEREWLSQDQWVMKCEREWRDRMKKSRKRSGKRKVRPTNKC